MRNLKRALSLTLASVMLLGMMVVGAGAAGYPDVTNEENVEAIEVLQAVEVMVGDDNGNFGPNDLVNRSQMAVVMAKLLNLDYRYYEATNPFWDVPTWARGYVGACYANGIVSGYGDGTYGAADSVTAVQAASMMMRALGYFKYSSDYKDGFETATVRQGTRIGIFKGLAAKSNEPLTRNDVAQMALNALRTSIVEPDDNTINIVDNNGNLVASGGQVNYVVVASNQSYARAIDRTERSGDGLNQVNGYTVELGEQLYDGKLELRDNTRDDFGRPARTWVNNGTEIGSYAKKELMIADYTDEVKGKTIYELLGQSAIRDNELYTYYDGADNSITKNQLVRSYDSGLANTGRGVLTEVYLDSDEDELYIVSINTWLAQATSDYNANSESITLTVYDGLDSSISKRVDLEDAPYIANMKKDDWCLVQWADESAAHSQKTVLDAFDVEIREDQKVTGFKRGVVENSGTIDKDNDNTRVEEITIGGETIKNNAKAWYKFKTLTDLNNNELVGKTYTVYLDQYGNFIGAELYSGNDQYVFITGYDRNSSNISVNTAKAAAIFTDGTMQAIDVNTKDTDDNIDSYNERKNITDRDYKRWREARDVGEDGNPLENMWYKYTVYNGVYTLTPVDEYTKEVNNAGTDRTIDSSKVYLVPTASANNGLYHGVRSYGEDASIYITVDNDDVDTLKTNAITEVTGVYTGAQDVDLIVETSKWVHAVCDDNYIIAAVVWGEAEGAVDNYAYIRDGVKKEWTEEENGSVTHFWEFDAIMNGVKVTETIKSRYSNTVNDLKPGTVQQLIIDNSGYVTRIKDIDNDNVANAANKVYDNYDFRREVTTLEDYDVYHLATTAGDPNPWVRDRVQSYEMPNLIALGNGRYATDLYFQGNTIRYTADPEDVGLFTKNGAKAVVYQRINNSNSWENYDSVSAAYSILNDADESRSGKQFDGQIIAALDSNGVAAWVLFIDSTPTNSVNPNYNSGASNVINNVSVNVRSSNVNIVGRNIGATISRYGDLTVSIPVASNVVSATADRVTVTVDGVYRFDADYTFGIVGSQAQFTLNDMDLDSANDIVVNIYGFNARTSTAASYSVTVTPGVNGTVTADQTTNVAAGTTVTVTAKPDSGYVKDEITIKTTGNMNQGDIVATSTGWTFPMPAADVTVTVTFKLDGVVDHYDYFSFMGQWFRIPMDANGNALGDPEECDNPNVGGLAAFSLARAAVIPEGKLETGGYYSFKLGSVGVTALWNGSKFVNLKFESGATTAALREGATQIGDTGNYILVTSDEKEIPAVTGEPKFTAGASGAANEVDLDLGDVIVGGKLPTEILIDDTLTAEIEWQGDANGNGIADEGETLTYTYKTVKAAAGKTVTGETEITVGEKTYSVPASTMNSDAGVAVDNEGVTGENVNVKGETAGLDFTLKAAAANAVLKTGGTAKVSDIQKNVSVSYNENTKTFAVTGELIYKDALTDYSTNDARKVGYFAALDLDWSELGSEYEIKLVTYKDNKTDDEIIEKTLTGEGNKELLLARVAGADGKVLDMPNRGIKVTNKITNAVDFYKIDFSGVTCPTPELLTFKAVEKEDVTTGLGDKKFSAIQTGVKVETDDATKTIKLTGTLHPVTDAWTAYSNTPAWQTGYFVGINISSAAITGTSVTIANPNTTGKTMPANTFVSDGKGVDVVIRVADKADAGKQAVTKGNVTLTAFNGTMMTNYTLDLSGLTLEQIGSGNVKLTPITGKITGLDQHTASEYQKNVTISEENGTFYISGELSPIKWTEFSSNTNYQKGYYISFNIDAGDIAGAKAWSVRGATAGDAATAKDDFVFFLGKEDLKKSDIKQHTLYVLNATHSGEDGGTPSNSSVIKTYTLDFSGVTLAEAEPFTVAANAGLSDLGNVHQSLLCDTSTYSVTVDHQSKKIIVKGDLYAINDVDTPWANKEVKAVMGNEAYSQGYFVSFKVNKGAIADSFAFNVLGFESVNNGTDAANSDGVLVRVAALGDTTGAAGKLNLKIGEGEYETYEFDLSGVNFKLTGDRTEPAQPQE